MSELAIAQLPLGLTNLGPTIWFLPALALVVVYYKYVDENIEGNPFNQEKLHREYDFIIVGAGSAGAVVANRLSENPYEKVLLLEAGGDETSISDVPVLAAYLQLSDMDWKYKTEVQDSACLGLAGKRCNWPRGKVLGGSSVLNYMLYVRGNHLDYDSWEALGNPGWGSRDAIYYFKKSEDNRNPYIAKNKYFHSTGGYLSVSEAPWRTPLAQAFVEAGVEIGYKNRDYNSRYQAGFMIPQGTIRDGSRCSTSKAFLRPIRYRKNLHVAKYAFVMKVLIDPHTKRAYGVKIYRDGKVIVVHARKEVILSAGAVNTPQLLMLSGIGPKMHLQEHHIPVIQDLPVGHNLQDHIAMGGVIFLIDHEVSMVQPRYENMFSAIQYAVFGGGPFTVLGGVEGIGFVQTKFINKSLDFPDIEFHFTSGSPASDGGKQLRKTQGFSEEVWTKMLRPISFRDCFQIFPMLLRPKSKGFITLRSGNPFHKPYITHNYLTEPIDVLTLVEGAKIALQLGESYAFKKYGAKFHQIPIPGCEYYPLKSDDYFACLARHYTATIYHPSGTAKMGPYWDPTAVVDPELKVYGISGLRVIDASIMPNVVSGNTNAPVIMIGEKGADLIKSYWYGEHHKHHQHQQPHHQEHQEPYQQEHHQHHEHQQPYQQEHHQHHEHQQPYQQEHQQPYQQEHQQPYQQEHQEHVYHQSKR